MNAPQNLPSESCRETTEFWYRNEKSLFVPISFRAAFGGAHAEPVTDDYFGTKITDPYRWMEAKPPNPHFVTFLKAQNQATQAALAKLSIPRSKLLTRIQSFDSPVAVISAGAPKAHMERSHSLEFQAVRAAPFKKLPARPGVSSPSVAVADRGGEEVNAGFSDFGAGSGNQLLANGLRFSCKNAVQSTISLQKSNPKVIQSTIYLQSTLIAHFGRDNIFMDVDSLPSGVDFVKEIKKSVESCDVLISVIGRGWMTSCDRSEGKLFIPAIVN